MTKEVGQGSGSSGYIRFISLLFTALQFIYSSYILHEVCNHAPVSYDHTLYIPCLLSVNDICMVQLIFVFMLIIVIELLAIMMFMFTYFFYIIIIMLIYGIKMIWKLPIYLTLTNYIEGVS